MLRGRYENTWLALTICTGASLNGNFAQKDWLCNNDLWSHYHLNSPKLFDVQCWKWLYGKDRENIQADFEPSNKWSGYHHYNIQPCLEMDFHCHLRLMKGCLSLKPTTKTRPLMLWVPALVAINWLAWCLIILQGQTRQIASGCHGSS